MFVELIRTIVELVGLGGLGAGFFTRVKQRHRVAVVAGGLIGEQFHMLLADGAQHRGPGQHFGVAHFVELFRAQVQEGIVVAVFKFPDAPAVEGKAGW